MTCLKCDGAGWLRFKRTVPAFVYGEPKTETVASVCPVCLGSGKVKVKLPKASRFWTHDDH